MDMLSNDFLSSGFILIIIGSIVSTFRGVPGHLWTILVRQTTIAIEIRNDDSIFRYFEKWINQEKGMKFRDVVVDYSLAVTPAPGFHFFTYKGKFIILQRIRKESHSSHNNFIPEKFIISFFPCRDLTIAKEFLEEIRLTSIPDYGHTIEVQVGNIQYDIRKRSLSSVFLDHELKNQIVSQIRWFLDNRKWYEERGIPWRIGFLLYGPPGNGKTSFVKALASEFEIFLKVIQMQVLKGDAELCYEMSTTKPQMILLEDVDCYDFAKSRVKLQDQPSETKMSLSGGVTTSGLLNAIDGVTPSEGRILFFTTNHEKNLDAALLRPGRIDRQVLVDNATQKQAFDMFCSFFPSRSKEAAGFARIADGSTSMADVQNKLLSMKITSDREIRSLEIAMEPEE